MEIVGVLIERYEEEQVPELTSELAVGVQQWQDLRGSVLYDSITCQ